MFLRHIHLPQLTLYSHASALQNRLVRTLLSYKASPSTNTKPPDPTVITSEFHPVYTCGRREIGIISDAQKAFLTTPTPYGQAGFHEALRGGQTTFHGPGQLTAYPILDLRQHRLTPRGYVCLLEAAVMETCTHYSVKAQRTNNPGVWVSERDKICALGVHLRRNVTSHGIGLNVCPELSWFGRIVACGLEGKGTTSLQKQGVDVNGGVHEVAEVFVQKLAERLDRVEKVARTEEHEVD